MSDHGEQSPAPVACDRKLTEVPITANDHQHYENERNFIQVPVTANDQQHLSEPTLLYENNDKLMDTDHKCLWKTYSRAYCFAESLSVLCQTSHFDMPMSDIVALNHT